MHKKRMGKVGSLTDDYLVFHLNQTVLSGHTILTTPNNTLQIRLDFFDNMRSMGHRPWLHYM